MAELVVKKYATALFDVATSEEKMEQYESEVKVILQALNDEPDFMAVLQNQKVTLEQKISLIENVFIDRVDRPIVGLMVLTVKKSREIYLTEIFETFLEMIKAHKGILKAVVTSAVSLSESQIEQIKLKLENSTKSQIEIQTVVDPAIIAGLIIRVGDKVVDASIQGEMTTLKKQLSELRLA